MKAPFNAPQPGTSPLMKGFVTDYINNFGVTQKREPTLKELEVIMGSFSPEMLPVVSTLAREFAVCDHWFFGVPSQTFCNRFFSMHRLLQGMSPMTANRESRSGGKQTRRRHLQSTAKLGRSWTIYYDEEQVLSLTGFINGHALRPYWKTSFRGMSQFYIDVATANLPDYAFIEPRLVFDHNDMYPPVPPVLGMDIRTMSGLTNNFCTTSTLRSGTVRPKMVLMP